MSLTLAQQLTHLYGASREFDMARFYIDNRLKSGANDGSSPENAWQSLMDYLAGSSSIAPGDTVELVAGSGPYSEPVIRGPAKRVMLATDIYFDAASNQIRSTTTNFTLFVWSVGDVIRVQGSHACDRQYEIASIAANAVTVHASNNIPVDEPAGNPISITVIEHSDDCVAFYCPVDGASGNPVTVEGNKCEIYGGPIVGPGSRKYRWNRSSGGINEYYLTMIDGSNPSLVFTDPNYCLVVDGYYTHESAGETNRNYGTPGSLSFDKQGGCG